MLFLGLSLIVCAAGEPTPSDASARSAFVAGQTFFRAAKYAEAVTQFEKAHTLKPHAAIYFNIARCHEELGNVPLALKAYRTYLHERPDAADREEVTTSIAALERKLKSKSLQQLMVNAEPSDATVFIDGATVGPPPAFIELGPGDHRVRIERNGLETISRTFVMSTQKSMELSYVLQPTALPAFTLEPVAAPPQPADAVNEPVKLEPAVTGSTISYPLRSSLWLPIAATAVGSAVAAGGFVFASSSARDLDRELLEQGTVTPRAQQLASRGQLTQTLGWAGVGLAAAGVATSVVFLLVNSESPLTPTVSLAPGATSIGLSGSLP